MHYSGESHNWKFLCGIMADCVCMLKAVEVCYHDAIVLLMMFAYTLEVMAHTPVRPCTLIHLSFPNVPLYSHSDCICIKKIMLCVHFPCRPMSDC